MADEMNDLTSITAIAVIAEQLKGVTDSLQRTETQLGKLDDINAAVSEMRISLALKADMAALSAVDNRVTGWMGQFKGALTIATLALGFIQMGTVAGIGFVVTHLEKNETAIAVVASRVDDMQRNGIHQQNGGKTKWGISLEPAISSSGLKLD